MNKTNATRITSILLAASLIFTAGICLSVSAKSAFEVEAKQQTYSADTTADNTNTYLTSLTYNDVVIITSSEKNVSFGDIKNKQGQEVPFSGNPVDGRKFVVKAGSKAGSFAFLTTDGDYLAWNSGNTITTSTEINSNSSWDVSRWDNDKTHFFMANTAGIFRYLVNGISDNDFATYGVLSMIFTDTAPLRFFKVGVASAGAAETTTLQNFTDEFNSNFIGTGSICDPNGSTTNTQSVLEQWTLLEQQYNSLDSASKVFVAEQNPDANGSDIEKMIAQYVYIYNKYGKSLGLNNFMARDEIVKNIAGTNKNNNLATNAGAIGVVALIGGLTIILAYVSLRKKYSK